MFLFIGMALEPLQLPGDSRELRMALVGALFSLPFILFSMAGGYLADRFSKRTITIGVKVFEIAVMLLAVVGLAGPRWPVLLACVFLMGTHSAFFGPSKYGLLPELLPEKRLSWGNGMLELGTFLAIILGTIGGGWLFEGFKGAQGWAGLVLVGLAVVGLCTSLGITGCRRRIPPRRFRVNFLADLGRQLELIRRDRVLWLACWATPTSCSWPPCCSNTPFTLRQGRVAAERRRDHNLSHAGPGHWHRPGQLRGRLSLGRQDRIRPGAARLAGHDGLRRFSRAAATVAPPGHSGSWPVLGFFGGFFIVPISALSPASAGQGGRKAWCWPRPICCRSSGIFVAAAVFYLLAGVAAARRRATSSWSAASMTLAGAALRRVAPARLLAAVRAVDAHAHRLSHPRGWPRQHPRAKAARCSSATTSRSWTRCCCWPPPTGRCASSCSRASTNSPG